MSGGAATARGNVVTTRVCVQERVLVEVKPSSRDWLTSKHLFCPFLW